MPSAADEGNIIVSPPDSFFPCDASYWSRAPMSVTFVRSARGTLFVHNYESGRVLVLAADGVTILKRLDDITAVTVNAHGIVHVLRQTGGPRRGFTHTLYELSEDTYTVDGEQAIITLREERPRQLSMGGDLLAYIAAGGGEDGGENQVAVVRSVRGYSTAAPLIRIRGVQTVHVDILDNVSVLGGPGAETLVRFLPSEAVPGIVEFDTLIAHVRTDMANQYYDGGYGDFGGSQEPPPPGPLGTKTYGRDVLENVTHVATVNTGVLSAIAGDSFIPDVALRSSRRHLERACARPLVTLERNTTGTLLFPDGALVTVLEAEPDAVYAGQHGVPPELMETGPAAWIGHGLLVFGAESGSLRYRKMNTC